MAKYVMPSLSSKEIKDALHSLRQHDCSPALITYLQQLLGSSVRVQRNIKDAIFTSLFSRLKYLLELYKTLHPEDTKVTTDELRIITLENIIANGLRNDLGFAVRDQLFILMEAQSTWSWNIVIRILCYLTDTWENWLETTGQIVYRTKKVSVPKPELYAIFPGQKGPDSISLAKEFFDGDRDTLDCRVKCIYHRPTDDILGQYIRCTEICDEEIRKTGRNAAQTADAIRRRCMKEGILTEFMEELGGELVHIVELRTEAEIQEMLIADSKAEGRAEGRAEGKAEGKAEGIAEGVEMMVSNLLQSGTMTPEQIASAAQVPYELVQRLAQEG